MGNDDQNKKGLLFDSSGMKSLVLGLQGGAKFNG
jgi:hypothetical protein